MQNDQYHFHCNADIDECESDDMNNCHENAQCTNTVGTFTCSCKPGYTGDGAACTSKLIMERLHHIMQFRSPLGCTETLRSHFCLHADIDECESDDLNNCHENAQCINTEGSFTCSCNTGYTGDGVTCTS